MERTFHLYVTNISTVIMVFKLVAMRLNKCDFSNSSRSDQSKKFLPLTVKRVPHDDVTQRVPNQMQNPDCRLDTVAQTPLLNDFDPQQVMKPESPQRSPRQYTEDSM
jgi:hypothetical protein